MVTENLWSWSQDPFILQEMSLRIQQYGHLFEVLVWRKMCEITVKSLI